jgi:phosphopantetheinyl transferase
VGLDVTVPDEFREGYPYERAFGIRELEKAQRRISGGAACAAALIWAGKEAAVKALGCGFHLVDPRSVEITHISPMVGGRALLRATIPLRRKSTHVETACVVYESPEGYMCIATYVGVNRAQSENAIYESNGI